MATTLKVPFIEPTGLAEARIQQLIKSLSDPDAGVRAKAADGLAAMGPRAKEAVPALTKALSDPDRRITRAKAAELCRLSGDQASRLLRNMRDDNMLEQIGKGRGSSYVLKRAEETRAGE